MLRFILLWMMCVVFICSCSGNIQPTTVQKRSNSSISSVSFRLPSRDVLAPNAKEIIDGYHLVIEKVDGDCHNFSNVDKTLGWNETTLQEKIGQGCNYNVIVEIGKLASSSTALREVYFTNRQGSEIGHKLSKEYIGTQKTVSLQIVLTITEAGRKAGLTCTATSTEEPTGSDQTAEGDYNFLEHIKNWIEVENHDFDDENYGSNRYQDVLTHTESDVRFLPGNESYDRQHQDGNEADPDTIVHESKHGLSGKNYMQHEYCDEFLYYKDGKGVCTQHPQTEARKIIDYLPEQFKVKQKFYIDIYLGSQLGSFPKIMYQFEEWNAYIHGHRAAVEISKAGRWDHNQHVLNIETGIVALYVAAASILTLQENEPRALDVELFKAVFAWQAEETMSIYKDAENAEDFRADSVEAANYLLTNPDSSRIREAVKKFMGPIWTKRVFGY